MARYGQKLDYGYDPSRDDIYPLFVNYFENPRMRKIKDINNFSMYMIKIHALLGIEYRYLIAFVLKDDTQVGSEKFLNDLQWESLQTRTLTDDHDIPFHSYLPRRLENLDQKISLVHKDDQQYVYNVKNLPLKIVLLPKTKGIDYSNSGTVTTALETYQTLVSFN
jgi:hypothetical protein